MRARVGNLRFLVLLAVICVHSESLAVSAAPVPCAANIDSCGNQKHADMWPNALVSYPTNAMQSASARCNGSIDGRLGCMCKLCQPVSRSCLNLLRGLD